MITKRGIAITGAEPRMKPSRSSGNVISGNEQAQQFADQSPEPFRNPSPGANLNVGSHRAFTAPRTLSGFAQSLRPVKSKAMSQAAMNEATGYAPSYKPAGQADNPLINGYPQKGKPHVAPGSGTQPLAKRSPFKTNQDIFNYETMARVSGRL